MSESTDTNEGGQGTVENESTTITEMDNMPKVMGEWDKDTSVIDVSLPTETQNASHFPQTNLGNFLQRTTQIYNQPIASTDGFLTELNVIYPWEEIFKNKAVLQKISNFRYLRGSIKLTFSTIVSPASYGLYYVSAVPHGASHELVNTVAPLIYPEAAPQTKYNARIDMAISEDIVMELPFFWPYEMADWTSTEFKRSWSVHLFCYQALQNGTDTTVPASGTIRVFAEMGDDLDLVVPCFHAAPIQGKVADMASSASSVATQLGNIPVIGAYAKPASQALKGVSLIADALGFTKEADPKNPDPVTIVSTTNNAVYDGKDSSTICALTQTNSISIDNTIAGLSQEDECSNEYLFSKWTLVATQAWDKTDAAGKQLGFVPVTPFCYRNQVDAADWPMTTAGYVGFPFQHWRGSMEYMVYIPMSKMHRGTLQFSWDSDVPLTTTDQDVTNVIYNNIVDVSTGKILTFDVGYAKDKPYMLANPVNTSWAGDSTVTDGVLTRGPLDTEYVKATNGQIYIKVVNPLVSPSAVTSTNIFIFARAKPDMRFYCPRFQFRRFLTSSIDTREFQSQFTVQGALGDDTSQDVHSFNLVPCRSLYPGDNISFGESFMSVRAALQKPSYIQARFGLFNLENEASQLRFGEMIGKLPPPPGQGSYFTGFPTDTEFNWAGYYRVMFGAIAGSTRYKFMAVPGTYFSVGHVADSGVGNARVNWLDKNIIFPTAATTYAGQNRGAEFTVPWYGPRKFDAGNLLTGTAWPDTDLNFIGGYVNINETNPNLVDAEIGSSFWVSFGPDVRASMFRFCPMTTDNVFASVPNLSLINKPSAVV